MLSVSYIEIYKEVPRDLLWGEGCVERVEPHELHVREDDQGNTGMYMLHVIGLQHWNLLLLLLRVCRCVAVLLASQ